MNQIQKQMSKLPIQCIVRSAKHDRHLNMENDRRLFYPLQEKTRATISYRNDVSWGGKSNRHIFLGWGHIHKVLFEILRLIFHVFLVF